MADKKEVTVVAQYRLVAPDMIDKLVLTHCDAWVQMRVAAKRCGSASLEFVAWVRKPDKKDKKND